MEHIFFALWFFLPVGIANSAPVFANVIPGVKEVMYPMDFHRTFRGKRIFGSHKTFRGLIAGIILATFTVILQQNIYGQISFVRAISFFDYTTIHPLAFGTVCALGALLGDAIESFFKRQIGVKPGQSWFPFDQLDYIVGGIIATAFYIVLPVFLYVVIVILWFGLHLLFSWIGYVLGLKKSPI